MTTTMSLPSEKTILLVDDDRLVLATLGKGLERAGYLVTYADGGMQALDSVRQSVPDLALLDIRMPDLSGLDVAEAFHKEHIPFIMLTAHGDKALVSEAVEHGALGYLVKPLDVSQVIPQIETAIRRSRDFKQLQNAEEDLKNAVLSSRQTSMAVGIIMERFRLNDSEAFQLLRSHARSERRKIEDVAKDMLASIEHFNWPTNMLKET